MPPISPQHSQAPQLDRLMRRLVLLITGLLVLLLVLTVIFIATKPATASADEQSSQSSATGDKPTSTGGYADTPVDPATDGVTLARTEDAGIAYQDSLIFVGDSLTAHLASRGVLTDGQMTRQVWRTENNMLNLNSEVTSAKILFPGTGEALTIAEAADRAEPSILIITLGTDYGVAYLNEADFKACYTKLVTAIQKASPKTTIILQSIFPVTAGCTLLDNSKIDTANTWVKAVAAETGCRYLDTQSVLKDENNCLKEAYCISSDGIHLTAEAYKVILSYIRTHAVTG